VARALKTMRAGMGYFRYLAELPPSTGGQYLGCGAPPPAVSFWDMGPSHVATKRVTAAGIVRVAPGRARDGSAVVTLTLSDEFLAAWETMPIGLFTLSVDKCLELASLDALSQLYGLTVILDMRRASLRLMTVSARPDLLRMTEKRVSVLTGKSGFRVVGLWLLGAPWYARVLVNTVRTLLPEKIRQRLHVAPNPEALLEAVNAAILPVSCGGGTDPSIGLDECLRRLRDTAVGPTRVERA